ncbi:antitoxin Xre/MbcA/ParS toxin-binding domain-containing protein [Herbaspirillum robiniae]|uniref:DUF2384 domain-containing protein n=1 Tax=Herbaspirillum robiniae TaxID=2014887 RepID=A0ABX2MA35_9BURK|nr:antitoxin Xre/MbcA/ParS toxin-binding domain-containing protein [Herbaspirillum robiniae]NUU04676.1 DUF2384 domain-containing protein [Herbaspirillum robiniae]
MPKVATMKSLRLSRTTIERKTRCAQTLSPGESERVLGVLALVGKVQAAIEEERTSYFDAAKWLARWLVAPFPALGDATPSSFLDTMEGQKYVGNLLETAGSGAYA